MKNIVFALGVLSTIFIAGCEFSPPLTDEDFKKSKWIEVKRVNNNLKSYYFGEKIAHNKENWYTWFAKVDQKNLYGLNENVRFPDLDGDGKVGE